MPMFRDSKRSHHKAQEIIKPFLRPDLSVYLFSPTDADAERRARRHSHRKKPTAIC